MEGHDGVKFGREVGYSARYGAHRYGCGGRNWDGSSQYIIIVVIMDLLRRQSKLRTKAKHPRHPHGSRLLIGVCGLHDIGPVLVWELGTPRSRW